MATKKKKAPAKKAVAPKQAHFESMSMAVKKKGLVQESGFQFQAAPALFQSQQYADNSFKRFHGSRLLASWLPREFISNNTDHFGYLFPGLARGASVLPYTAANRSLLERLGDEIGDKDTAGGAVPIADSSIPSGYTYLGQFIDHDITLDVNSDISKPQDANKIPNMRSPSLDLDAIYGQGPGLNPFLYDHTDTLGRGKGVKLLLGKNTDTGNGGPSVKSGPENFGNPASIGGGNNFDVQRTSDFTAIIGDPRNDENLIVSQLHHCFIKFHNKIVDHLIAANFAGDLFTESKRICTQHYQWVVVNDFLKTVADPAIVDLTFKKGGRFFPKKPLFMPVEFSVAAYRFGHSMIRNNYFMNAPLTGQFGGNPVTLGQVFGFIRIPQLPVFSNWVVDFNLYFNGRPAPASNGTKFNFARKIDTRLAIGLETLPDVPVTDSFMKMLAKRNLVRGLALGLPSGQAVAKFIKATVLTPLELQAGNADTENMVLNEADKLLLTKTPLWYYILKEAEIKKAGNSLGEVGSVIIAETFCRLLKEDKDSYLNTATKFKPTLPRFNARPAGDFDMTDILNFAGLVSLD